MRSVSICLLVSALAFSFLSAQDARPLRPGRAVDGALSADSRHTYSLELSQGDWVYGEVDQKTVDVVVRILDPQGEELQEIDVPNRGPEPFTFDAAAAGTYTVEVTPFENNEGDYTITIIRAEPVATDPEDRVDQIMTPFSGTDRPGGVVAVVQDGELAFARAYGMANLTYDIPFEVGTVSNIGSVTKQFTAMGILLLQAEGKLTLEDDIREHIPELPDFGTPITIRRLLTHTSGYREIYNFLPMSGFQGEDAFPRELAIRIIQNQPELQDPPNTLYNYNNTAFILLATTIERISEQTFPEYMKERVFGPLGMSNTRVKGYQGEIIPGSAMGYVPAETGGFRWVKDLSSSYGAGGIYTTAEDLAKWMLNYRDMTLGGPEAIEAITTPNILANGDTTSYGLGLGIGDFRGQRRLAHTGGDVAHRTYFGYYPEIQGGVILMSNHAGFRTALGTPVALAFFEEDFEPVEEVAEETEAALDGPSLEQLEAIAGEWVIEGSMRIDFTVEDGALHAQARGPGQGKIPFRATSDSTFVAPPVDAALTFHWEDDGTVGRATLHQGGDSPLRRVEAGGEEEAPNLSDFVGRYYCQELETFYDVYVEEEQLKLKSFRLEPVELSHQGGDTFAGSGAFFSEVAFERVQNGAINGFRAGNGRTKGVWFRRH